MKKLLIVVDYQKDFVDGALGFPEGAALEGKIVKKMTDYRTHGHEIVFTMDTHQGNYLKTAEGQKLPIPHCIEKTEGWRLYGKVGELKLDTDVCFHKSGFGSTALFEYLTGKSYHSIELVGVVSNICVVSNAILVKTALPEVPVIVDAACVASSDSHLQQAAFDVMQSVHIDVVNR